MTVYPEEFRASIIAKTLPPNNVPGPQLVRETSIPKDTLCAWRGRVRTQLRRRHKLTSRAQAYQRFPGQDIYGRYGVYKLPTTAPWRAAHALV